MKDQPKQCQIEQKQAKAREQRRPASRTELAQVSGIRECEDFQTSRQRQQQEPGTAQHTDCHLVGPRSAETGEPRARKWTNGWDGISIFGRSRLRRAII